jgi:hypothetical protein
MTLCGGLDEDDMAWNVLNRSDMEQLVEDSGNHDSVPQTYFPSLNLWHLGKTS